MKSLPTDLIVIWPSRSALEELGRFIYNVSMLECEINMLIVLADENRATTKRDFSSLVELRWSERLKELESAILVLQATGGIRRRFSPPANEVRALIDYRHDLLHGTPGVRIKRADGSGQAEIINSTFNYGKGRRQLLEEYEIRQKAELAERYMRLVNGDRLQVYLPESEPAPVVK